MNDQRRLYCILSLVYFLVLQFWNLKFHWMLAKICLVAVHIQSDSVRSVCAVLTVPTV